MITAFTHLHKVGENIDWVNSFHPLNLYSFTEVLDALHVTRGVYQPFRHYRVGIMSIE